MEESNRPETYSVWRREHGIPYKIRCTFNMPDTMLLGEIPLDQHHPAYTILTPDLPGPEHSLSMFFHNSIPQRYQSIIYYHELVEARAMYGDKHLPQEEAHQLAVKATTQFVKSNFGKEGLAEFNQWNESLSK